VDLINNCDAKTQTGFLERVERIKKIYAAMSDIYQINKGKAKNIPLK
jgi:hypothetical protein